MISFFPTPYPDELLYSILARYHIRSGNLSPKATLRDLFCPTTIVATTDLPSHIEALIGNLPPLSKYTAESIIHKHTLYPFYAPFLFPKTSELVLDSMKKHCWGDVHARAGIMASAVAAPRRLQFCPQCLDEDEEKFGEPYWHRLHQVTGVLVCRKHLCLLHASKVAVPGENRHEFYPASRENCVSTFCDSNLSGRTFNELINLAQDIEWIVNAALPSRSALWYQHQYGSLLIDKRLATATGRVRQAEFINLFSSYFSSDLLNLLCSDVSLEREHNWLSNIVRKHRKAFHPVRHLLLIRFLCGSASAFFSNKHEHKPFGDGPWKCFNGAAKHYSQPVITDVKISWSTEMKKAVGTFSCSCGFTYSSSAPCQPGAGNGAPGKIKAFGRIWEERLKELVEVQGLGLREVSRQLKVDPLTVKHHTRRLGLNSRWQPPPRFQEQTQSTPTSNTTDSESRDKHRGIWLELQQKNRAMSKTGLRQYAPDSYTWLYRNDRTWLDTHSPARKKVPATIRRVDWNNRDREILNLAKDAVRDVQRLTPLVRVTIGRIGKIIGWKALLERHLDKLPLTNSYLMSVVESIRGFQIRRIRRTISILKRQNDHVKPWQVIKLAGLDKARSENIAEVVADEIRRAASHARKKVG